MAVNPRCNQPGMSVVPSAKCRMLQQTAFAYVAVVENLRRAQVDQFRPNLAHRPRRENRHRWRPRNRRASSAQPGYPNRPSRCPVFCTPICWL